LVSLSFSFCSVLSFLLMLGDTELIVEDGILAHVRRAPVGNAFKNDVDNKDREGDTNRVGPLDGSETVISNNEHDATILADTELSSGNNDPKDNKHGVSENTFENVELVVNLTSGNHVPDLHEHESVEDESQMARSTVFLVNLVKFRAVPVVKATRVDITGRSVVLQSDVRFRDEEFTSEENDEKHNALEDSHPEDVLGHLARHNVISTVLGLALKERGLGELSGQSESSKGVHDQVNPQKLDSLERSLLGDARANESGDQGTNVHGKLELQETLDVVVHIATPHSGLDNGREVVISDEDISGFLAHISASKTHSETDISFLESGGIVGTVTSDSDDSTHLAQTGNEKIFVFGTGTSHDFQVRHHSLEFLEVFDGFNTILVSNDTTHLFVEFGALNADIGISDLIVINNFAKNSNGLSSDNVVTSNHADSDTSFIDSLDGSWYFSTDNVHNTEDANKGQARFLNVLNVIILGFIVVLTVFVRHHILVGKSDGTESLLGVGVDNIVEVRFHFIVHFLDSAIGIKVVRAAVLHNFGGTLNHKALLVLGIGSFNVFQNSRHTLAL